MIMFGCAMSIFARSTCAPSGNSPAFMRRSRSRFSSTRRSRYGLAVPGVGHRAAALANLLLVLRIDVRLARSRPAARRSRTAARSSRSRSAPRPTRSRATATSFLMASTYFMSSVNGFVSSKRRLHAPPNSCASPKFRQIDFAWPMCRKPFGSGGKRVATWRPKRFVATSSATSSRMKSRRTGFVGAGAVESGKTVSDT